MDSKESPESISSSQTLDRAVQVMQVVVGLRNQGIGLSDVVKKVELTKPTTRRLLLALIGNGLIEQDPVSRKYFPGPEIYSLGLMAAHRFGIQRIAERSLARIAKVSGDSALLSVRRDYETVCLAREEGHHPLRSHVLQPGDRHPLGCGASGIAFLAAMSDEQIGEALEANAERLRHYPQLSTDILWDLVAETREQGYAFNRGFIFEGSWGVAVCVSHPTSGMPASLAIASVESRLRNKRHEELVALLMEEKAVIESMKIGEQVTGP
ncbi:MAG: IclR family transcriptional regulator [Alcaligenes sp.]